MMRSVLLVAAMVLLLFAGCTSKTGGTPSDTIPVPSVSVKATPTTGVIRGVVVDAAIHPLAGVLVSVPVAGKPAMTTTTAADGGFGVSGLPPATYFVSAKKAGFQPTQVSVEVQAGVDEPKPIKILLQPDPASAPYFTVFKFDGYIECSMTLVVLRFAACSLAASTTGDNFLADYTLDQPPQWIQSEAVWSSTQSAGDSMGLSITDFSTANQENVNATDGPSPIFITVNATTAAERHYGTNNTVTIRMFNSEYPPTDPHAMPTVQDAYKSTVYPAYNGTAPQQGKDAYNTTMNQCRPTCEGPMDRPDCIPYPTLFAACLGAGGVGATLEQPFTVYTHVFYHYQPPHGWRFTHDGDYLPPK